MARMFFSLLSGGIFGAGLFLSGMVDTAKVQGFLDILGDWNPSLAFVMGGAMIPMAIAWRVAAHRRASYLALPLPGAPATNLDRNLILGSVLFGMGWAIAGFCPGPAIASLSFGGVSGLVFIIAMAAAMLATHIFRTPPAAKRKPMDIRALTPTYAVSPQIDLSDLAAVKAAGFTTVIDNRPDGEIPENLHAAEMQAAAKALGLTFVINPLIPGNFTDQNIAAQQAAVATATGPVFAYCASGNRCSVIWAMMNAGKMPVDDLIGIPARFGYQLGHLRPTLEALAAK